MRHAHQTVLLVGIADHALKLEEALQGIVVVVQGAFEPQAALQHSAAELVAQSPLLVHPDVQIVGVVQHRPEHGQRAVNSHLMIMQLLPALAEEKIGASAKQVSLNDQLLVLRQGVENQIVPLHKFAQTQRVAEGLGIHFARTVVGNAAMLGIAGVVPGILHQDIPHPVKVGFIFGQHPGDAELIAGPGVEIVELAPPSSPERLAGKLLAVNRAAVVLRGVPVPDERHAVGGTVVEELPAGTAGLRHQDRIIQHHRIVLLDFAEDAGVVVIRLSQTLDVGFTELFHGGFSVWGYRPGLKALSRAGAGRG